jgi:hypothetical protein
MTKRCSSVGWRGPRVARGLAEDEMASDSVGGAWSMGRHSVAQQMTQKPQGNFTAAGHRLEYGVVHKPAALMMLEERLQPAAAFGAVKSRATTQ